MDIAVKRLLVSKHSIFYNIADETCLCHISQDVFLIVYDRDEYERGIPRASG